MEEARSTPSRFNVDLLSYADFWDMKALTKSFMKNYKWDTTGTKVEWLNIKCLQVNRESECFKFKYSKVSL